MAGWILGITLGLVAVGAPERAAAQTWTEFGPMPAPEPVAGDLIQEPFFAFLMELAEGDSLGVWDGDKVKRFVAARGAESRFPLDELVAVARKRPGPDEIRRWPGVKVAAHWDLDLKQDLKRPMPYDILGYHPGSLLVSRHLELVELVPGELDLVHGAKKERTTSSFRDTHVFALTTGYMVLDADGLVDRLLGSALDDAWTVGLVTSWQGERRVGLGVSLGRKGRKIYGEFDFACDKVLAHGRPAASALSAYCRRWLDPEHHLVPPPWQGLERSAGGD